MKNELNISLDDLQDLKSIYQKAVEANEQTLWFKDNEILTAYAKYLIEYLENEFKD